jgi:hypothetical protein
MTRLAALLVACALALGCAHANAQAGATPPIAEPTAQSAALGAPQPPSAQPPTADEVCRTLEQAAAENALPVELFAAPNAALQDGCLRCQVEDRLTAQCPLSKRALRMSPRRKSPWLD